MAIWAKSGQEARMGKIRHSRVGSAAGEAHPACICTLRRGLDFITSVFHILNLRGRQYCAMPMGLLILGRCLRISDEDTELDLLAPLPHGYRKRGFLHASAWRLFFSKNP